MSSERGHGYGASPVGTCAYLSHAGWDPDVRAGLAEMIRTPPRNPRPIAALDFDHTIATGDVSETLLALLDEREGTDRVARYEAACRADLYEGYVGLVSTLIAGRTETEARALAQWTIAAGARRGTFGLRAPMRELVWALQRHGWEVWVVTAAAEVLVQAVAERVGIGPDRVIGMRSPLDGAGRYAPTVLEPVTWRGGKIEALRRATGRDPAFAAGDSPGDRDLMAAAANALLLDRGDEEMLGCAAREGWWIQPTAGASWTGATGEDPDE